MVDLTTTYMGLKLKNPIIIGSSGLTNSLEKIKNLEANGAGAVVLKSIFEEQILNESNGLASQHSPHAEELDYLRNYIRQHDLDEYLKLIKDAKNEVKIPVIASINCISTSEWTDFAKKIQDAGADGLELNMFIMPADVNQKGEDIEKIYLDIVHEIKEKVTLPIAVKMSYHFSGLANMIFNFSVRKIDAIVLFNRFYSPDIDLDKMEITASSIYSSPGECLLPLRWVGMLSDEVKCDLAASTGIHDGKAVLKNILAGAKAVQVSSVIYQKGPEHINRMLEEITGWMEKHNFDSLSKITGKLSHKNIEDPVMYQRVQFMKYFASKK